MPSLRLAGPAANLTAMLYPEGPAPAGALFRRQQAVPKVCRRSMRAADQDRRAVPSLRLARLAANQAAVLCLGGPAPAGAQFRRQQVAPKVYQRSMQAADQDPQAVPSLRLAGPAANLTAMLYPEGPAPAGAQFRRQRAVPKVYRRSMQPADRVRQAARFHRQWASARHLSLGRLPVPHPRRYRAHPRGGASPWRRRRTYPAPKVPRAPHRRVRRRSHLFFRARRARISRRPW